MLEFFQKGGIMMYPIITLSIISVAIFIERLISLRSEKYTPVAFEEKVVLLLQKKEFDEAKELSHENNSALSNISSKIMDNIDLPISRLLEVAEESGTVEVAKLDKYQQSMQTIVSVAPLLGLLGTVFGMIKIFDVISLQGTGNAQQLSLGIAEALITTAAGLIVAIATQFFYHIVKSRADFISSKLEVSSSRIMNLLFKESK